jgi:hypothetical protein
MMTSALRVEKSASTYFSLRKLEKSDRVKKTRRRYQRNSPWVLRFQSLVFKKGGIRRYTCACNYYMQRSRWRATTCTRPAVASVPSPVHPQLTHGTKGVVLSLTRAVARQKQRSSPVTRPASRRRREPFPQRLIETVTDEPGRRLTRSIARGRCV